jgi:hypothetical protein
MEAGLAGFAHVHVVLLGGDAIATPLQARPRAGCGQAADQLWRFAGNALPRARALA